MSRITPNPTESPAADPSRKASPRPSGPSAAPPRPDRPAPRPATKGALFRALVRAGCDPDAAYNAEAEVRSMAAENLVAQLGAQFQIGFAEIQQTSRENAGRIAEHDRKLDALAEAGVERDRKLDALAEAGAERDRKIDALAEAGAERDRKIDALAQAGVERDRKIEAIASDVKVIAATVKDLTTDVKVIATDMSGLKEILLARTDALRRELWLVWGALGLLVTVLIAVFGFLFTR